MPRFPNTGTNTNTNTDTDTDTDTDTARPMQLTRLTLVTHASTAALRTAAFADDEPLDGPGAQAAAATAPLIADVDEVLCGPDRRTRQTAAAMGATAKVDDRLADCDYGRWRGLALSDVSEREPEAVAEWLTDPSSNPHGGESLLNVFLRIGTWLDERADAGERFERTVAVTHPAVVRAAIVHAIRATPESFWRIDVPPLTVTTIQHHGGRWTLRSLSEPTATP